MSVNITNLQEKLNFSVNYTLISRYLSMLNYNNHQRQGRDPQAGLKHSSAPTPANRDCSRLPRGSVSNRGFNSGQRVLQVPHAKGGRRCFPHRVEKRKRLFMNIKERRTAQLHILANLFTQVSDFQLLHSQCTVQSLSTKYYDLAKKKAKRFLVLYSQYSEISNLKNLRSTKFVNMSEANRFYNLFNPGRNYAICFYTPTALDLINKSISIKTIIKNRSKCIV
jgi:ribosomal protein L4